MSENEYIKLSNSSYGFFNEGFKHLSKHNRQLSSNEYETAIGVLGIATELFMKSYIAQVHPLLIYKGITDDLKIFLLKNDAIVDGMNYEEYKNIMHNKVSTKTIDFQVTMHLFLKLNSKNKKLSSYLRFANKVRNQSVHGNFSEMSKIDFDKMIYLVLSLIESQSENSLFKKHQKFLELDKSKNFLHQFDKDIIDQYEKKVELAKKNIKKVKPNIITINSPLSDFIIDCPICGNPSILEGYTENTGKFDNFPDNIDLTFYAESFHCDYCKLKLDSFEELELTSIDTIYDNNEAFEEWINDFEDIPDYEY